MNKQSMKKKTKRTPKWQIGDTVTLKDMFFIVGKTLNSYPWWIIIDIGKTQLTLLGEDHQIILPKNILVKKVNPTT